jgi:hypothetical protein
MGKAGKVVRIIIILLILAAISGVCVTLITKSKAIFGKIETSAVATISAISKSVKEIVENVILLIKETYTYMWQIFQEAITY